MRRERGVAFIFALAGVAALVAVVTVTASIQQGRAQDALRRVEGRRADGMVRAGIQRAIAELELTTATSGTQTGGNAATRQPRLLTDAWAVLGDTGAEEIKVGRDGFRVQILDGGGLINLNTATEAQLQRLPLTPEQVDSILDFRESGRSPRAQGAKDEFYNGLPRPYNAKLRGFDTVDELLQVKGFDYRTVYERIEDFAGTGLATDQNGQVPILGDALVTYNYSPATNPQGQALINVNANGTDVARLVQAGFSPQLATQIVARRNWTLADLLALPAASGREDQRRILDNLTTSGTNRLSGKVNLNTASETTLSSLPDLTPDQVQAIIQRQSQGFTTLGDLVDVPGLSGQSLQRSADRFAVNSDTFVVRVEGRSGSIRRAAIATIDLQEEGPRLISLQPVPYDNYAERWLWPDEPARETEIQEAG